MDRKGCVEHNSKTKVKKSSLKSLEEKRKKERDKKRRQREKMKQNPEAREKFKEKEREVYKKRKECGKIKLIANLNPREQRQRRKEWRTRQNKCRQKKKQLKEDILSDNNSPDITSNSSKVADGRQSSGRKRVRKERSAVYRALIKSQKEMVKYKKLSAKLKKRLQRKTENKQALSPKRKINRMLRFAPKKEIRKKLLFGEVLELELKEKAKTISTETEKRKFTNFVSGKIIKKYRLLQKTKFFLSNRQRLNIGCQAIKRRKKANAVVTLQLKDKVVEFFEDDASSALLFISKRLIQF